MKHPAKPSTSVLPGSLPAIDVTDKNYPKKLPLRNPSFAPSRRKPIIKRTSQKAAGGNTVLRYAGLLLVALLIAPAALAAPQNIEVAGQDLVKAGEAKREKMFIDLYRVALYLPVRDASMRRITQKSTPKAFHIEVLYDGKVPGDIPKNWAEELLPPLPEAKANDLRRIYSNLRQGDALLFTCPPGGPTSATLNGKTIFSDPGTELMAGVVDIFLGPKPVSEDMRARLLGTAEKGGWLF